ISGTANTISNAGNAGLATAGSTNGSYTVRATSGAVSGTATLTVSTATLSSLAITPVNPTLVEWASQQFTATGTFSNNSTQNLTSSVTWSVDHSNVITVSNLVTNTGLVTAVGVGSAVLTGSSNGITATTTITVVSGLIVTDPFDNGSGAKPGTLSYALLHATSGQVISFTLTSGSTINVGNALPPVKAGVQILAPCSITGGPTITLDGGFQAINGLTLSGNNLLQGFKLKGFWGKGLIATTFGNKLKCMAVIR
ncbi:MAG: Ig-like domain-containing protein, partial [Chloroflexota bacterium]